MRSFLLRGASLALFLLVTCLPIVLGHLVEEERHAEYVKRGYEWPLSNVNPPTPGWDRLMRRRLAQISQVNKTYDRYNAWILGMTQAMSPNYTENGWGLTRAPSSIVELLTESLSKNLANAKEEEYGTAIRGPDETWEPPLFIEQSSLNRVVLNELHPMHEAWAGIPLVGELAYGLRVYRNQSKLTMHVDQLRSHIISSILHVGHDEDSEPWPLFIEDFQGNTNEVVLESGDMLFYESAKCIHGRPRPFNGTWYSSIFVHYYPKENWDKDSRVVESHYAVPPIWKEPTPTDPDLDLMEVDGTSFTEPNCPYGWCESVNTVKWFGPAKEGVVITTGYKDDVDDKSVEEL